MPAIRLALQDTKILKPYRHVQRERAAGLALTIGAIAGVEQQRKRRDLVTDRAALAATGHRERRSRRFHGRARTRLSSHPTRSKSIVYRCAASAGHAPLAGSLLVEIIGHFDVDLERRHRLAALQLDHHLVGIELYVFRHHREDFLPQRDEQVGLAEQPALVRQQNLQPLPRNRGRRFAAAEQPQQPHAHAALRPSSRSMKPLRSAGTTMATSSPIRRREASI